jgi:outer membrane immunogenic protein
MRLSISIMTAAAVLMAAPVASAADLPVKASPPMALPVKAPVYTLYDWSGFYLGGHVGYFWGHTSVDEDGILAEHNAHTNGVIGGALAGYNVQFGPVVVGIEGDFGWSNAHGTGIIVPPPPPAPVVQLPNQYDLNWVGRARGRIGYAFNNWLVFAAGGFSVADFDFREGEVQQPDPGGGGGGGVILAPTSPAASAAQQRLHAGGRYYGWSVGGGVETAITRNLVGRLEFLYDDFGHKDYVGATGNPYRVSLTGETVRGALAWKFDPFSRY